MQQLFPCITCQHPLSPAYTLSRKDRLHEWFKCTECRHHFQTMTYTDIGVRQVVAESPRTHETMAVDKSRTTPGGLNMGCPTCGRYGNVKMTERRGDEYWRRHKCVTCGPYFTCETDEDITVHRKMPSKRQIEV